MLKHFFSTAVYGMLHYYGVIPLTDILVIGNYCDLCALHDYELVLQQISKELIIQQKVYFYNNFVCHKWVRNPIVIETLQREMVATAYKEFSLETYLAAGENEMIWSGPLCRLKRFLKSCRKQSAIVVQQEVSRLWREINNMGELVTLTSECVQNLRLPWKPEESQYMKVMEEIRIMADNMPRWFCKGFSYKEAIFSMTQRENS